ncbi:NADPH-dependent FMN reductase [Roseibium aggregatum]|uniref:NAD(P)H-dependent oxidoreductase n=1 Tax=Roseibium aggregatum TaxID=187304 RepID=A0A926S4V6_9HYPH|nr:NAD(P)H-dependent oxidoreductase [Roseibium aggregatum]MBD1545796.1 NAD(P)H-dependent oxidoreductase [Roseibium aggregatum]
MALHLQVILASTRPGRKGPEIGRWFAKYASNNSDFEIDVVDLSEFDLPVFDEPHHPVMQKYEHDHTKRWSETIDKADAYVFVTPEYDHTAPASLINALTYLSKEWNYKPAGFVSYGGVSGGLRAVQSLKPMMSALKLVPLPEAVTVPGFTEFLGESGFDANELHEKGAADMLAELGKWAGALKGIRTPVADKANQAA